MANDINMWNDIEELNNSKEFTNQAQLMLNVYQCYFINRNISETKKAIEIANKSYPDFPFQFNNYGITLCNKEESND